MSDDAYDEDTSEMEYGDSQGYSSDGGGYGAFEDIETADGGGSGKVGFSNLKLLSLFLLKHNEVHSLTPTFNLYRGSSAS